MISVGFSAPPALSAAEANVLACIGRSYIFPNALFRQILPARRGADDTAAVTARLIRRGLVHIETIGGSNNYVLWLTRAGVRVVTSCDVTAPKCAPTREEIRDATRVNTLAWVVRSLVPERLVLAKWNLPNPRVGQWPDVVLLPNGVRSGIGFILESTDESMDNLATRGGDAMSAIGEEQAAGTWIERVIIITRRAPAMEQARALSGAKEDETSRLIVLPRPSSSGSAAFMALASLLQPYVA